MDQFRILDWEKGALRAAIFGAVFMLVPLLIVDLAHLGEETWRGLSLGRWGHVLRDVFQQGNQQYP